MDADEKDRKAERSRQTEKRDRDQRQHADEKAEPRLGRLVDELADGDPVGTRRWWLVPDVRTEMTQHLVEPQPPRFLGGDGCACALDVHGTKLAPRITGSRRSA